MRILFVPHAGGEMSHGIPLLRLAADCRARFPAVEVAFLMRRRSHAMWRRSRFDVVDIDHEGLLQTELEACRRFRPDVVVDDCSFTTGYATTLAGLPRVTVARTGMAPGYVPRRPGRHSLDFRSDRMGDVSFLGLEPASRLCDLFRADHYLIPGIPLIECRDAAVPAGRPCSYSGPLLLDDDTMSTLTTGTDAQAARAAIEAFLSEHQGRNVVVFTLGTVAQPSTPIRETMRRLLRARIAVLSTVGLEAITAEERAFYYYARMLPLHFCCSRADLVVHHCGSATYHYPLLHRRASVTIGTGCYDRDDVAARLAELKLSTHVEGDAPDFESTLFTAIVDALNRGDAPDVPSVIAEASATAAAFSAAEMLFRVAAGSVSYR